VEKSELLKQLRIDRSDTGAPRSRASWFVLVGCVLLVLASGLLWFALTLPEPPTVRTAVVRAASQEPGTNSVLDASGYVTARRQATVSAKITGKVAEVLIEEGMQVKEGDVLARLDDTEAKAQLALAKAQLTATRAQLAEIRAQLVQAERDYTRQQGLADRQLIQGWRRREAGRKRCTMSNLVEIRGLTKTYVRGREKIEALHSINLDIPRGDFVALMGPSGSGKTTLLNLIGGLDTPTAGSLMVDGRRIDQLSSGELARWRAANVGFVFQFYNLLPALSAQRNVELPLLLTNLSTAQRRKHAEIALTLVGLHDRAKHKPKELSGGQEQRVAIARAIVSDPTLLVCDEPTGDLDRATADEILTLLQLLNREHEKTVVMVTHDPKAAEYARRQLHLDKGTLANGGDEL